MIKFSDPQYREIFHVGEEKYDLSEQHKSLERALLLKLSRLDEAEIVAFLNYQFEGCTYPNVFLMLVDGHNLRMSSLGQEKDKTIIDWIERICDLERKFKLKADDVFCEPKSNFDSDVWEYELHKYINHKSEEDIIAYLHYGKKSLVQGLGVHNVICKAQYHCSINKNFDSKIDIIDATIAFIHKSQEDTSKPLTRMEWNGTQKELGELFAELKKKNWIVDIESSTLKSCFTKSNTIEQVLKPNTNTSTGEDEYHGIYTDRYTPKFFGIKENPKVG